MLPSFFNFCPKAERGLFNLLNNLFCNGLTTFEPTSNIYIKLDNFFKIKFNILHLINQFVDLKPICGHNLHKNLMYKLLHPYLQYYTRRILVMIMYSYQIT